MAERRRMAAAMEVAERQLGLITRAQLHAAGFSGGAIDRATASGWLRRVHRGVYRVGPVVAPHSRELAAVLASGPAAVSHVSAAALRGLLPNRGGGPVDVKVVGGDRGRVPGIRPHRVAAFGPGEVTMVGVIPVTNPLQTLLDLANLAALGRERVGVVERAVARADRVGLVSLAALAEAVEALCGRAGSGLLRAVLRLPGGPAFTRSAAEEALLALIREAGLPPPAVNASILGFEVDFLWPNHRLVVEVDGFAFHASRASFLADHRRDARLMAAGFRVLRLTWDDVAYDREGTKRLLTRVLGAAPAPGSAGSRRDPL
jgi:very-short-patch-repair endonuclease